jgi:Tfp pilus assembly protein PilF
MFCVRVIVYGFLVVGLLGCAAASQQQQDKLQQADVHYKLGISHLQSKNPSLALKELLIAVEYDPDNADIHAVLAQSYQLKKAFSDAERHYLRAISLSDNEPRYQNNLGSLYLDMKQWDKAIEYFGLAESNLLFHSSHIAKTGMGFAYYNKKDYAAASRKYEEVVAISPGYPIVYFLQSENYLAMGQTDKARKSLEQAIVIAPGYLQAIYQLGVLLLKEDLAVEAKEKFERVVELDANSEWGRKSAEMIRALSRTSTGNN